MKIGFTLVELSIVLVIVGLLIGGILVGQSMSRSAELMQIQKNVFYYEVNAKKFLDITKYLPGDIPNALTTPMGLGSSWGNGTGHVGYTSDGSGGSGHEYWGFFYHMERLNLIKRPKQYSNATGTGIYAIKGTSGLKENGVRVMNSEYYGAVCGKKENIAALASYDLTRPDLDFYITARPQNFTASDAASIDQKYDDGIPESGDIWTYPNAAGGSRALCKTADYSKYDLTKTDSDCPLLFCLRSLDK